MTDRELIEHIIHNPEEGIKQAIKQYGAIVNAVVIKIIGASNGLDVQECVSNVFIKLWQYSQQYDEEKGALKGYIVAIARNEALSKLKRIKISTIEELESLKACANISKEVNTIYGTWEIKFDLNTQNQKIMLQPDTKIPLTGNRNLSVREIQLSKCSLVFLSPNFTDTIDIEIKFKDSSKCLKRDKLYVNTHTDKERCLIYNIDKPIDLSAVEAIIINGTPIVCR